METINITTSDSETQKMVEPTVMEPRAIKWIRTYMGLMSKISPKITANQALSIYSTPRRTNKRRHEEILQSAGVYNIPFTDPISDKAGSLRAYQWGNYGPKVLLVHGWESKAATYRNWIQPLLRHGYSVIAYDSPAHGRSSFKTNNLVRNGEALKAILEYFSLKDEIKGIVAHSFGASTVAVLMTHNELPQYLDKIALISMLPDFSGEFKRFTATTNISGKTESQLRNLIEKRLHKRVEDFDLTNNFNKITHEKMMIVHDYQDQLIDIALLKKLSNLWTQPQYFFTNGLGHFRILKSEKVIDRIIEFLLE